VMGRVRAGLVKRKESRWQGCSFIESAEDRPGQDRKKREPAKGTPLLKRGEGRNCQDVERASWQGELTSTHPLERAEEGPGTGPDVKGKRGHLPAGEDRGRGWAHALKRLVSRVVKSTSSGSLD
jgi:hypothetical protein